jgi:predicted site-specific integrase-resolvase
MPASFREQVLALSRSHKVVVECTRKTEPKSPQEEWVEDLLTILTVFSAPDVRIRSQEFRRKVRDAMKEMGGEEPGSGHQDGTGRNSQGGQPV